MAEKVWLFKELLPKVEVFLITCSARGRKITNSFWMEDGPRLLSPAFLDVITDLSFLKFWRLSVKAVGFVESAGVVCLFHKVPLQMFLCFKYTEIHFMWFFESLAEMSGMNMDNNIQEIIRDASNANLTQDEIKKLLGIDRRKLSVRKFNLDHKSFLLLMIIIGIAASNLCSSRIAKDFFRYLEDEYCLIEHTLATLEISRPVTNCTMCQNLVAVPKLEHVSKDVFTRKYAYTGVPLVVTNATGNWTALKVFDFKFLRKLYNMSKAQRGDEVNEGCQFFPYLTNFRTLKEVFQMSDRRASLHEDQWYVGWYVSVLK